MLLLVACGGDPLGGLAPARDAGPGGGPTVIVVAAVGVVINTLTALLFVSGHADANVRGAFLHMAADAAVSAGVVIGRHRDRPHGARLDRSGGEHR